MLSGNLVASILNFKGNCNRSNGLPGENESVCVINELLSFIRQQERMVFFDLQDGKISRFVTS